jgi:hypothetical protein
VCAVHFPFLLSPDLRWSFRYFSFPSRPSAFLSARICCELAVRFSSSARTASVSTTGVASLFPFCSATKSRARFFCCLHCYWFSSPRQVARPGFSVARTKESFSACAFQGSDSLGPNPIFFNLVSMLQDTSQAVKSCTVSRWSPAVLDFGCTVLGYPVRWFFPVVCALLLPIFLLCNVLGSVLNFWFPREHSGPRPGFDSIAACAPPWIQSARAMDYRLSRQGASFSTVSSQLFGGFSVNFSACELLLPAQQICCQDSCCRQDFRSPLWFPVRCAERPEILFGSAESSPGPNLRFPDCVSRCDFPYLLRDF